MSATTSPGPAGRDRVAPVRLRRSGDTSAQIDVVAQRFGGRVGLEGVLGYLDRRARMVPVPGALTDWGFTWERRDAETRRWWPQGITTSADAHDDARYGEQGAQVVLTSWYRQDAQRTTGSRISVVDLGTLHYRHVVLVVPRTDPSGEVRLEPLKIHAGGLVWFGPWLHVAATGRGIYTCHVDDVLEVPDTARLGARFVLPVRHAYRAQAAEGTPRLRYSFLSLDRGTHPPELVVGEYARGEQTRRLVRFGLDPESHHLACDEHATSRPHWSDDRGASHMQGAAAANGEYFVTASRGSSRNGHLLVGRPGAWREHQEALPPGPEDITWWPEQDLLWSVTEHPRQRYVFCIRRGSVPGVAHLRDPDEVAPAQSDRGASAS